jgi:hypothetical protein
MTSAVERSPTLDRGVRVRNREEGTDGQNLPPDRTEHHP